MSDALSEKIKKLRLKMGISQKQLSDLLGISDQAVSKWEIGLSNPSIENLFKLSKIFSAPVDYFTIGEKGEKLGDAIGRDFDGMQSISELYRIGRGRQVRILSVLK